MNRALAHKIEAENERFAGLRVPAHAEPYVEALGVEEAVVFFMTFGGSEIYLSKSPTQRSSAKDVIDLPMMLALGEALHFGPLKVPTAKRFVAEVMLRQGTSIAQIARTLHMDDSRVRRWLGPKPISRQLTLFSD